MRNELAPIHVQQREVLHQERVVVALAEGRVVLVHAEPGEPERLAVDEELGAADLDGAHADALVVAVDERARRVDELDLQVVEVAVAGRPGVDVGHGHHARRAGPGAHRRAVGVAQHDPHAESSGPPTASTR